MPKVKDVYRRNSGNRLGVKEELQIPGLNPESFNLPVYAGNEINLKVAFFSEGNDKN